MFSTSSNDRVNSSVPVIFTLHPSPISNTLPRSENPNCSNEDDTFSKSAQNSLP